MITNDSPSISSLRSASARWRCAIRSRAGLDAAAEPRIVAKSARESFMVLSVGGSISERNVGMIALD